MIWIMLLGISVVTNILLFSLLLRYALELEESKRECVHLRTLLKRKEWGYEHN